MCLCMYVRAYIDTCTLIHVHTYVSMYVQYIFMYTYIDKVAVDVVGQWVPICGGQYHP